MVPMKDLKTSGALAERRDEMLRRLGRHRKKGVWTEPPPKGQYRKVRPTAERVVPYHDGEPEPIIPVDDLYSLPREDAFVTVNAYDALILNSKNLLIVDIDFGNPRYEEHGGAADVPEVLTWLRRLKRLDQHLSRRFGSPYFPLEHPQFSAQSYTVYRTAAGCRVICTSRPFPWATDGWLATHFMRFMRADPQYMALCEAQKCYRARLTPKPWRDRAGYGRACRIAGHCNPQTTNDPSLLAQRMLHDEISGVIEYPISVEERYLA